MDHLPPTPDRSPQPAGPAVGLDASVERSPAGAQGPVVAIAATTMAFIVLVALHPFGTGAATMVDNALMILGPLVGAWWCIAAGRSNRRAGWTLIGTGLGAWVIGQTVWSWYEEVIGRAAPVPSLADAFYLGAVPLIGAGLLSLLHAPGARWGRTRVTIESGIICCTMLLFLWPLTLGDVVADRTVSPLTWAVAAAYPLADAVLIALTLMLIVRSRELGPAVGLLCLGLASFAVGDVVFAYLTKTGRYATGSWSDAGWILGSLVIGMAARRDVETFNPARRGRLYLVVASLPHLCAASAGSMTLAELIAGHGLATGQVVLLVTMIVLLGSNHLPVFTEFLSLTSTLEQRVESRTAALRDATDELQQQQARLLHLAHHDALTGLPNRRNFIESMAAGHDPTSRRWVILLDLDGFKAVNDGAGHHIGDAVLRVAAQRLRSVVPAADLIARLGGDEFALLCRRPAAEPEPADVVERLLRVLREPFSVDDDSYVLAGSAGMAEAYAEDTPENALSNADVAMYAAKGSGGDRWVLHTADMGEQTRRNRTLVADLRHAVERNEFVLHYQPVLHLETAEVTGAEALVRWIHPRRGLVAPDEFIPAAEANGIINALGLIVLRSAVMTLRDWIDRRIVDPTRFAMNINLSTRQLEQPGFVEDFAVLLDEFGIDAHNIVLEVTETSLLSSSEAVLSRLIGLRQMGARLAMDDFGTGYAGFEYLKRGLFDVVKLDRSLISAGVEQADWAIAAAVMGLAGPLCFEVVAEGVEELEQVEELSKLGCAKAQGYFFQRPVAEAGFCTFVRSREVMA